MLIFINMPSIFMIGEFDHEMDTVIMDDDEHSLFDANHQQSRSASAVAEPILCFQQSTNTQNRRVRDANYTRSEASETPELDIVQTV